MNKTLLRIASFLLIPSLILADPAMAMGYAGIRAANQRPLNAVSNLKSSNRFNQEALAAVALAFGVHHMAHAVPHGFSQLISLAGLQTNSSSSPSTLIFGGIFALPVALYLSVQARPWIRDLRDLYFPRFTEISFSAKEEPLRRAIGSQAHSDRVSMLAGPVLPVNSKINNYLKRPDFKVREHMLREDGGGLLPEPKSVAEAIERAFRRDASKSSRYPVALRLASLVPEGARVYDITPTTILLWSPGESWKVLCVGSSIQQVVRSLGRHLIISSRFLVLPVGKFLELTYRDPSLLMAKDILTGPYGILDRAEPIKEIA